MDKENILQQNSLIQWKFDEMLKDIFASYVFY